MVVEGCISIWTDGACSPLPSIAHPGSGPGTYPILRSIQMADKDLKADNHNSAIVEDALTCVLQLYTSRWLHDHQKPAAVEHSQWKPILPSTQSLRRDLYHRCRDKVKAAMEVNSYKSILALMLFSWAPVPLEFKDVDSSRSMEQALLLYYHLRPERRLLDEKCENSATLIDYATICWLGVILNTATATVHRRPPLIQTSAESERIWDTVRERDETYRIYLSSDHQVNDALVVRVCRAASASKLLAWKTVNTVQTALYRGQNDVLVKLVHIAQEQNDNLRQIYGNVLDRWAENFTSLSPYAQLCWSLLQVHINLGYLLLAEAMENVTKQTPCDTLAYMTRASILRFTAGQAIANTARVVSKVPISAEYLSSTGLSSNSNLFALDPFPEFAIEGFRMAGLAISESTSFGGMTSTAIIEGVKLCLTALQAILGEDCQMSGRKAEQDLQRCLDELEASTVTDITTPGIKDDNCEDLFRSFYQPSQETGFMNISADLEVENEEFQLFNEFLVDP